MRPRCAKHRCVGRFHRLLSSSLGALRYPDLAPCVFRRDHQVLTWVKFAANLVPLTMCGRFVRWLLGRSPFGGAPTGGVTEADGAHGSVEASGLKLCFEGLWSRRPRGGFMLYAFPPSRSGKPVLGCLYGDQARFRPPSRLEGSLFAGVRGRRSFIRWCLVFKMVRELTRFILVPVNSLFRLEIDANLLSRARTKRFFCEIVCAQSSLLCASKFCSDRCGVPWPRLPT